MTLLHSKPCGIVAACIAALLTKGKCVSVLANSLGGCSMQINYIKGNLWALCMCGSMAGSDMEITISMSAVVWGSELRLLSTTY